jgi:hypothetical protein
MNSDVYGVVYKLTNNINDKIYIGQTSKSIGLRISQHLYDSKVISTPINKAIKEHGMENFTHEIICECEDKEKLLAYEGLFIELYKSYDPDIGYNRARRINGKDILPENRSYKNPCAKCKHLGVRLAKKNYAASIWVNYKEIKIGCFSNEDDAAKARDIRELEYIGREAILNFPKLRDDYISGKIIVKRLLQSAKNKSVIKGVYNYKNDVWIVDINNQKIKYKKNFKTQQEAEDKAIEIHKQIGTKNYYKNTDPYIVFTGFKTKKE